MFQLHPQLAQDCEVLCDWPLSRVLLMRDANYPWLILVPRRVDKREIYELSEADQAQLLRESSRLAQGMAARFGADKMNIAALGNMVPQLHLHHIARFRTDPAWPKPVWGQVPAKPYTDDELAARRLALAPLLDAGL